MISSEALLRYLTMRPTKHTVRIVYSDTFVASLTTTLRTISLLTLKSARGAANERAVKIVNIHTSILNK